MNHINMVVRLGNCWKMNRTIRTGEDANKAIRDFRRKLWGQKPNGRLLSCKFDHEETAYILDSQTAIEQAMLNIPVSLELHLLELGMLPDGYLSAVHQDVRLVDCYDEHVQQTFSNAAYLVSELWADADELLTVCHLFQQSVLRNRDLFKDNPAVAVVLESVLDTHELLDRRIRHLRDAGQTINEMLEAA